MSAQVQPCPLLGSFWGGGFDSISPLVHSGDQTQRIDLVVATQHDSHADLDYRLLARLGMRWTREDARWHLCEPEPGRYDFAPLEPMIEAARDQNVQIVWSWMHYGCPTFVNPLNENFPERLADFGARHLEWLQAHGIADVLVCPINEISYYTWHVSTLGSWYPFVRDEGHPLKERLMAAHRRCYERAKQILPGIQILMIDPFYYAVGSEDDPDSLEEAAFWRNAALEAADRLCDWTDILGMNFYADGQVECYWEPHTHHYDRRMLPMDDPRRISLTEALRLFRERYGQKPVLVTETSVRGDERGPWITQMTDWAVAALQEGLPLRGLCWYPVLDVPDWGTLKPGKTLEDLHISHSGLIHARRGPQGLERILETDIADILCAQEARLEQVGCGERSERSPG
ncbi:MAG TPA: beta-galactosidase [Chthonomonadaceae bacterium]|nr:beta-galactosidase [Chthonomonadaceae bacterium]